MAKLTSKELTAIGDTLSAEQNLIKKYTMYAAQASDGSIRQKCEQMSQRHQAHCTKLISHLG